MTRDGSPLHRLLTGTLIRVLLWILLLLATVIIVNVIGIYLTGSVNRWQQWIKDHSWAFLLWRLLLYAATLAGWIWMRRRLLNRERGKVTRQRLQRVEAAAVLAVLALEISQLSHFG